MVERLIGQAGVHVDVWNPDIRRVAGITFLLRDEMPEVLAGGNIAVVTGRTRAENLSVVDRNRGTPGGRRVAGFTHVRCQRMRRALTCCINAVMAAKTVVSDVGVIEVRRYPGHSRMAIIAIVTARDMPGILAHRDRIVVARNAGAQHLNVIDTIRRLPEDIVVAVFANISRRHVCRAFARLVDAVVAADAVAGDVHVVEVRRYPRDSRMTVIAIVAARNVIHILACRIDTVMTRKAGTEYLQMVDRNCGRPRSIAVTILAYVGGQNVSGVLAGGVHTVVAVETAVNDIDVVEVRRNPCNGCMTIVASFAALDVCGVLAGCGRTIVAGVAGTQYVQVVYCDSRVPEIGAVAVFADIRRCDVGGVLTRRVRTVVAAEAVACNVCVVKHGRHPGDCRMAVVALLAGHDMRRVLSGGVDTVVT